jgi:hypothetical protein
MKFLSLTLAFISLFCGLASAYYWYRASRIKIYPAFENMMEWVIGNPQQENPYLIQDINMMPLVTGNMVAFTKSRKMNACAAVWTALTVVSGATANFLTII